MSAGTQSRSRAQNVLHNLMSSAVSKALVLFLSFIARSVFIRYLSEVYLGVNGLYSNVLNMLSLAELGFGTAMVFSMYRPLAEHDDRKLAALLRVYRRAYTVIGCVVFAIGLSLVPVLHLLIKLPADMQLGDLTLSLGGRQLTVSYVNFYYLLFLLNAAVSYWFWGYRRSVFVADQKEHICTNIRSVLSILRALLQIAALAVIGRRDPAAAFTAYLLLQLAATVAENIWVALRARKYYPCLHEADVPPLEKAEVRRLARDVGSTAVSRISHVALNSTDNIIISTMLGTVCVGQLSNYTFIADSLTGILCLITAALTPSLGNYFVEKSREESYSLFRSLTYANLWLYALATAAMLTLFNPFMTVWLHNPDYLLSAACAVAISLNFFVAGYMTTLFTFRSSLGLFSQGWFRPIVVSVLNIGLSVLLAFLWRDATFLGTGDWGLFGVLIATTLSRLLVNVWYDPIIIHRYGFGVSARPFFLRLLRMVGEVAVRVSDGAEHLYHLAATGSPGQNIERGGNGVQEQVRTHRPAKACNGRGIKGNAIGKRPPQLLGHDGDVFLFPRNITKSQADELHILLLHILVYVLNRVNHCVSPLKKYKSVEADSIRPKPRIFDSTR